MNISLAIPEDADGLGLKGVVHPTLSAQPQPSKVDFVLDGVVVQSGAALVWAWDTTKTPDGTHKLSAIAYYKTRKSTAGPLVVTVSNTAPAPTPTPLSAAITGSPVVGATMTVVVS